MLEDVCDKFRERENELVSDLFEAKLEAAVLKAKLEARDEADAKHSALFEALITAQIENARLQAKLEVGEEKARVAAELIRAICCRSAREKNAMAAWFWSGFRSMKILMRPLGFQPQG